MSVRSFVRSTARQFAARAAEKLLSRVDPMAVDATSNPRVRKDTSEGNLKKNSASITKDASRDNRRNYGKYLSPDVIDMVLRQANDGLMQNLTDISRETVRVDPHLASVLMKRFFAVASLPWEVQPATGLGIDRGKALEHAVVVNAQLRRMGGLKQSIYDIAWGRYDGRCAFEIDWNLTPKPYQTKYGTVNLSANRLLWIHPRRLSFGSRRELRILDEGSKIQQGFSSVGVSLHDDDLQRTKLWRKFIAWTPRMLCDYPEREGLAPSCLYWAFFKRFSARDRMQLLELFGKPWRIIKVNPDADIDADDLEEADRVIDALGHSSTARLPQGADLEIPQPGRTAGHVHQSVIDDANREISKLVLGQTGTTDGVPAGLNSNQTDVMADEQTLILRSDADAIAELLETYLCDATIEVNFGPEALDYAPRFVLRYDRPVDRNTEIQRLTGALNAGLGIRREEAYEVVGFGIPDEGDFVVRVEQPPSTGFTQLPQNPRPIIIPPELSDSYTGDGGSSDDSHADKMNIQVGSDAVTSIVTVNEARAAQGLPPLALPDGTPDPDGDLTIKEFNEKKMASAMSRDSEPDDIAAALVTPERKALLERHVTPENAIYLLENILSAYAVNTAASPSSILLTEDGDDDIHEQPSSDWGSPEDLLRKGRKEMMRTSKLWADSVSDAIDGLEDANEIVSAIRRVFEDVDIQPYARAIERRMVQGAALGAMDHALEIGDIEKPEVSADRGSTKKVSLSFSTMPFNQAIRSFVKRDIVSRSVWDTLRADVKRKSFTVAGIESQSMRQKVFEVLAKEIEKGADLRYFKKTMLDALRSAGLISVVKKGGLLSASHVETVFRTNVLNAYNYGRYQHASQPKVVKRFPIWGIVSIQDNRGKNRDHRRSNGIKLLASDSFWKRAYPPFGYNCRCRVRSYPAKYMSEVVDGSTITWLPDPGFTSGYVGLI